MEYKSLPSGLHSVRSDLVYFIHEGYAAVSAFVQEESHEQHRNASFVAVGVLVPSFGRLGRAWTHAEELTRLAEGLVKTPAGSEDLERFWTEHKLDDAAKGSDAAPIARRGSLTAGLKRKRGPSDVDAGMKTDVSATHPALYMPALLDTFGPLLFPLYRAALLRKRILLMGGPPVQPQCNAVYILSVLASLPSALGEVLQPNVEPLFRIHPLYSVGIHDIPSLSSRNDESGWIATTTDDILGEKHQLYDVLVDLTSRTKDPRRRWPRIRTSDGRIVKATQRDLRRYRLLRSELRRTQLARERYSNDADGDNDVEVDRDTNALLGSTTGSKEDGPADVQSDESEAVESVRWTAMAYDSFMWWASAGEQNAVEQEETSADRQLLEDLPDIHEAMPAALRDDVEEEGALHAQVIATVLTAYFHRLTSLIIHTLAGIVEEADDETEDGIEEDAIQISADGMRRMGLDAGSEADRAFVHEAVKLYFGRDAVVADGAVRVCGMRVC